MSNEWLESIDAVTNHTTVEPYSLAEMVKRLGGQVYVTSGGLVGHIVMTASAHDEAVSDEMREGR